MSICLFSSFLFLLISNFPKRLISLLVLEGLMLLIIWGMFLFGSCIGQGSFFSIGMMLLVMMVIDSVLGICMLVGSCRSSTMMNFSF